MIELRILPAVFQDAAEAASWYDEREAGLGERFLTSLRAAYGQMRRGPSAHRIVYRNYRRILLESFPYAVYFRLEVETAFVVLLFHAARDPETLRRILRRREKSA